ncbi:hypothetical protein HHI36_005293, partial [Cryptolaemus montrouzieri]
MQTPATTRGRWRPAKAAWSDFSAEVDENITHYTFPEDVNTTVENFCRYFITSAEKHIGKTTGRCKKTGTA